MEFWDVLRVVRMAITTITCLYATIMAIELRRDARARRARDMMAIAVLDALQMAEENGVKVGVMRVSLDDDGDLRIVMKHTEGENHAVQTDGNTGRDADNAGRER